MPQLLILAAIGAGAYVGARWLRNKTRQISRDMDRAAKARKQQRASGSPRQHIKSATAEELVKDPATGIYRVKK